MQFFEEFPEVSAVMSERSDGPMGSSTNPGAVSEFLRNRERFLQSRGFHPRQMVLAGLVHGTSVKALSGWNGAGRVPDTDGLLASRISPGITIGDCYAVFLLSFKPRLVGVIHAGWRGLVRGIIRQASLTMLATNADPAAAWIAVSPGIQKCCFVVRDDENGIRNFRRWSRRPDIVRSNGDGTWNVDLTAILREELDAAGFRKDRIRQFSPECTACPASARRFLSYRRDKQKGWNMLSVIGFRDAMR